MNDSDLKMRIREYKKGDEYRITDLFRISSVHIRTVSFFKWANLESPFKKSISLVLEDEHKNIIGHYAVMILDIVYRDKKFRAGFGAQLVVHPLFRNFKLMWQLLNHVWSESQKRGLDFIYAFPNNNIWPIKNRLMEWKLVREFQALEMDLKQADIRVNKTLNIELQRISNLLPYKGMINKIFRDSRKRYYELLHIERNYNFVLWRFFQHPLEHYPFFLVKNKKGAVIGWIALKFYRKSEILYGHIIDFVVSDEEMEKALIERAINYLSERGADVISVWGNTSTRKKYEEFGFVEKGFATNFGIRVLKDRLDDKFGLADYSKWDMAMSYSDAF